MKQYCSTNPTKASLALYYSPYNC